jgi:hypothetical protein
MRVGKLPFAEIADDHLPSRRKDLLGNLAARVEPGAGERDTSLHPRQLHFELAALAGEHHEPALGTRHFDGRIHHQGEDFIQHAAASQPTQRVEQRRDLSESADDSRRAATGRRVGARVVDQEYELGPGRPADLNLVAVHETPLGHGGTIDVRAAPRPAVANQVIAVASQDFGVITGHVGPRQLEVVHRAAPYREGRLVEDNDPPALGVIDFKACVLNLGHGCADYNERL